jgi:hypothetical protein
VVEIDIEAETPADEAGGMASQYPHEHRDLAAAMATLAESLAEVASFNMVGDALYKGFETLAAQLDPLRQLVPPGIPNLRPEVSEAIVRVQAALKSPDWASGGAMPVTDDQVVGYIGQPRP